MVNSAGLSTMQPVGSRPGPKAFTYVPDKRGGWVGDRVGNRAPEPSPDRVWELRPYLVWEAVWWGWLNVGYER